MVHISHYIINFKVNLCYIVNFILSNNISHWCILPKSHDTENIWNEKLLMKTRNEVVDHQNGLRTHAFENICYNLHFLC